MNLQAEPWLPTCWVNGRGFTPKFLWFHRGFSQMKIGTWPFGSHLYTAWNFNLGTSRKSFPAKSPNKKTAESIQKLAPAVCIQLILSTNHGEFQKWSAAKRCQHQNSPTKINHSNPFHLLTLLDLPVWTITHPRSLHEVVSDTNLIEELLGAERFSPGSSSMTWRMRCSTTLTSYVGQSPFGSFHFFSWKWQPTPLPLRLIAV